MKCDFPGCGWESATGSTQSLAAHKARMHGPGGEPQVMLQVRMQMSILKREIDAELAGVQQKIDRYRQLRDTYNSTIAEMEQRYHEIVERLR